MAVQLQATKMLRAGGRLVAAGESFSVRTRDEANLLKKLRLATDPPSVPPPPVPETPAPAPLEVPPVDNGVPAEDEPETEDGEPTGTEPERKKRTYKRRDMTAEK